MTKPPSDGGRRASPSPAEPPDLLEAVPIPKREADGLRRASREAAARWLDIEDAGRRIASDAQARRLRDADLEDPAVVAALRAGEAELRSLIRATKAETRRLARRPGSRS